MACQTDGQNGGAYGLAAMHSGIVNSSGQVGICDASLQCNTLNDGAIDGEDLSSPMAGCTVIGAGECGHSLILCTGGRDPPEDVPTLFLPFAGLPDLPSASLTGSLLLPNASSLPVHASVKAFPRPSSKNGSITCQQGHLMTSSCWGSGSDGQHSLNLRKLLEDRAPMFHTLPHRDVRPRSRRLQRSLKRFSASQNKNMRIGVHVVHLKSGEETGVRAHKQFPLASVAKLPIMLEGVAQLQNAEEGVGKLSLHTPIQMAESDKCIGSGKLWKFPAGTRVAFGACLELMQTISDNTAADLVLRVATMDKVRQRMSSLGMDSIDIHLSQRQAYLVALGQAPQLVGMPSRQLAQTWSKWSVQQRLAAAKETENRHVGMRIRDLRRLENLSEKLQRVKGSRGYLEDMAVAMAVDNVGPPAAVARLLAQLARGELFSPGWTAHCMGILSRQQYGQRRLPAYLPIGTPVYHKTGSILGVVNAAGIVDVGPPSNRIAIAAFVDNVRRNHEREAEAVIARMSRMAYNAYYSRLRRDLLSNKL